MTISISSFLEASAAAGVGGATLIAIAAYLMRSWITERLKNAIAYEYNRDLESHKTRIATISAAMAEGQRAAIEARHGGFDRLWKVMLQLRSNTGIYLNYIDIITEPEYATFEKMKTLPGLLDDLTDESFQSLIPDEKIEEVRPYVGEVVWAHWYVYQAFSLRSVHLARESRRNPGRKQYWLRDKMIRGMLARVLNNDELKHLDSLSAGGIAFVRGMIENKVIASWRRLITGEQFGEEAVKNAGDMLFEAQKVKTNSTNAPPG